MTRVIDDKTKPAATSLLLAWDMEATPMVAWLSVTSDDRHDLGHASVLARHNRGGDNEVVPVTSIERPTVIGPALGIGQHAAVDHLTGSGQLLGTVFSAMDRS